MTPDKRKNEVALAREAWERLKKSGHLASDNGHLMFHTNCSVCDPVRKLGEKAEEICCLVTQANWIDPNIQPCEVCGEPHQNYECCEECNYAQHTCHFCGDSLGHREVSACYIWM